MATTGTETTTEQAERRAAETGGRVYVMSREGKRQAYILLAGVASIWIFALWTLITILQDGVSGVEWVSLLLMLGMIVVAPVVAWSLLEEASAGIDLSYEWGEVSGPMPKGPNKLARFFLGSDDPAQSDTISNNKVSNIEAGDLRHEVVVNERVQQSISGDAQSSNPEEDTDEDGEPETILLSVPDRSGRIANPVSRFLHRQVHGSTLPVYGNIDGRAELLGEIASHVPPKPLLHKNLRSKSRPERKTKT
jgi:hypothetical protein